MGNWEVKIGPQKETLTFNDTRRETGKDVFRPVFLQHLAKNGEIVRREIRVTDPEGRPRYSDTFLIIDLKDEMVNTTLLFEHHINLGIRMVGVQDSVKKAQKILKHLEEIVNTNNKREVRITLPPTYRLNTKNLETPLKNG